MNVLTRLLTNIRGHPLDEASAVRRALSWVKMYRLKAGVSIPHRNKNVLPMTQETCGYMIATLYKYGEKDLAARFARWETSQQREDGAFVASDNAPYTFDTAQVIRGYLAVIDDMPELMPSLRKACNYVMSKIGPEGRVLHDTYDLWKLPDGSMLSEYGNLYVLPPLLQAGEILAEPSYVEAAHRGTEYFRTKADLIQFKPEFGTLSHYFGYMMEALLELGEVELAEKGLKQAEALQKPDGSIPAYPGVNWVCSTGQAQLAIAWYWLGRREPADKSMAYLVRIQNPSGGFYGSYGDGAQYFPSQEISWAVKFFLDAHYWKSRNPRVHCEPSQQHHLAA